MRIDFLISEPWDLPPGFSRQLLLEVEDHKATGQRWPVSIIRGGSESSDGASFELAPRYRAEDLGTLKKGGNLIAHLVRREDDAVVDYMIGAAKAVDG